MRLFNLNYRGIDRPTDVISFPQNNGNSAGKIKSPLTFNTTGRHFPQVLGDIVISVPKAIQQAADYGVAFYDELLRLLVHGLLHLSGYDHEINKYQKKKMEKKEQELFDAVKKLA